MRQRMATRRAIAIVVVPVLLAFLASLWAVPPALAQSKALLLGDSLTAGYYATTADHSYAAILQGWLSLYGYDASSQGWPGGYLVDIDASLDAIRASAPDLAVIEFGTNDAGAHVSTADFEHAYRELLETIRQTRPGSTVIMLGVWKQYPAVRAVYDRIISRLALEYGAQYVSLEDLGGDPTMSGPSGVSVYRGTSDGFHPNDAGHAALAAAVEDAIRWRCSVTLAGGASFTRSRLVAVDVSAQNRLSAILAARVSLDGTTWSEWATPPLVNPVRLPSGDGPKKLWLQFLDAQGVTCLPVSDSIVLDTQGPTTRAYDAVARRGENVVLRYRVHDALSRSARVTLVIRTAAGKFVRALHLGWQRTGQVCSTALVADFTPGRYRCSVAAVDLAGNRQSEGVSARLLVR
jgi:lysophospholipase L1-like esterase